MISYRFFNNLIFGTPSDEVKVSEALVLSQKINDKFDTLSFDTIEDILSKLEEALQINDKKPDNIAIKKRIFTVYYNVCTYLLDQHRLHGVHYFKSLSIILPVIFNELQNTYKKIIQPRQSLNHLLVQNFQHQYDIILKYIHYFPHSFLFSSSEEVAARKLAKKINDQIKTMNVRILAFSQTLYHFNKETIQKFRINSSSTLEQSHQVYDTAEVKSVNHHLNKLKLLSPFLLSIKGNHTDMVESIKTQEAEFIALKQAHKQQYKILRETVTSMMKKVEVIKTSTLLNKMNQTQINIQLLTLSEQSRSLKKKAMLYFDDVEYAEYCSFYRHLNDLSVEAKNAEDHRLRLNSVIHNQNNYHNLILYIAEVIEYSKSSLTKQGCLLLLTILSEYFNQLIDDLTPIPFSEISSATILFPKKLPTEKVIHFIDEAKMTIDIALSDFKKSKSYYLMEPIDKLSKLYNSRTVGFFKHEEKSDHVDINKYSDIFAVIIEKCVNFTTTSDASKISIAKFALNLLADYLYHLMYRNEELSKINTLRK